MSKDNKQDKFENLAMYNSLLVQAIMGILVKKGIATADEILETVDEVEKEMDENIRRMAREN